MPKTETNLMIQKAMNLGGYGPLTEDGVAGTKTFEAVDAWRRTGGADRVVAKGALKRIIMHWTAGGPKCSAVDKEHYHFIVDQAGNTHAGDHVPEDNVNTNDGDYAAHALNANTGSIGISMCGMLDAVESPFKPGPFPITSAQVDVFCELAASLCTKYSIPVSRTTVLTHAEVQPTLGIVQRGKWDINHLPGFVGTMDPVKAGDILRDKIAAYL